VERKLKAGGGFYEVCRRICGTATGDAAVDVNIEKTAPDNGGLDASKGLSGIYRFV
jgi:hypothetical protein